MAIRISKSQEGVTALRNFGSAILQELENINTAHDELQRAYDDVKGDLAHEEKVEEILEHICVIQADVCTYTATLSQKLNSLATALENFLNGGLGGN